MSADHSPIPRTLVYARHIGRELALLCLSSLAQHQDEASLDQAQLSDILERSVRMLTSEAEAYLQSTGKVIEAAYESLDQIDAEDALEHAESNRDLQVAKRNAGRELNQIRERLRTQAEALANAVNLLGESLNVPLLRILSDNSHVRPFTLKLIASWRENREQIDALINSVSDDWQVERMNTVDRDLIRVAATEMLFDPIADTQGADATPLPVAINEAVELAKKYGTPDSYRFVNAVLRNLMPHAEAQRRAR